MLLINGLTNLFCGVIQQFAFIVESQAVAVAILGVLGFVVLKSTAQVRALLCGGSHKAFYSKTIKIIRNNYCLAKELCVMDRTEKFNQISEEIEEILDMQQAICEHQRTLDVKSDKYRVG